MSGEIAIIGSTGRNSAAWIEAFLAAGFAVRNLVRDPTTHVPRPGITYVAFDLDDRATYQPALDGVDLFALVTPPDPRQTGRELALIEAAKTAKVRRILNLSVIGADLPAPITPFARWQAAVEKSAARIGHDACDAASERVHAEYSAAKKRDRSRALCRTVRRDTPPA